jgi:hypothetical protein
MNDGAINDGPRYGFVLRYTLRDEVSDWVAEQANAEDYGISCAFQQRQVEALTAGWLQVDTTETPSLLVWCDDEDAAQAFRTIFGAHVKDVVGCPGDRPGAYH